MTDAEKNLRADIAETIEKIGSNKNPSTRAEWAQRLVYLNDALAIVQEHAEVVRTLEERTKIHNAAQQEKKKRVPDPRPEDAETKVIG